MLEMKVPSPGESISEVQIAKWLVKDGDYVKKDQAIAELQAELTEKNKANKEHVDAVAKL